MSRSLVRVGGTAAPWRKSLVRTLRVAFLVGVLVFLVLAVSRQWPEVAPLLDQVRLPAVSISLGLAACAVMASLLGWRILLGELGGRLRLASAFRIYFLSQLGKYLPGSLWPAVAQMELARDHGVPRRTAASGLAVTLILTVLTGVTIGTVALPLASSLIGPGWLLLAVAACAVLVAPPVLNRVVNTLLRLARRDPLPRGLTWAGVFTAGACLLAMWALFGLHLHFLDRAVAGPGRGLAMTTSAFALAWSVGFLFAIAPAGVGIRETILVAVLGPSLGLAEATIIAVFSRLILLLVDVVFGVMALLLAKRRKAEV